MGHLNELQEKYGEQGLTVLSGTSEGAKKTERWVERNGYEPAYAYDKKSTLARYFGVRGIPDAVLVDGLGNVVYRGHPARVTDSMLEGWL